jgi:hypothetical protein
LITATLNSLKQGWLGQLGTGYNHILDFHHQSGWIR